MLLQPGCASVHGHVIIMMITRVTSLLLCFRASYCSIDDIDSSVRLKGLHAGILWWYWCVYEIIMMSIYRLEWWMIIRNKILMIIWEKDNDNLEKKYKRFRDIKV